MRDRWRRIASVILLAAWFGATRDAAGQSVSAQVQEHTATVERALRSNDMALAEREYRAIVTLDPGNSEAWTGLGVLLYGEGKSEAAVPALRSALKLNLLENRADLFLGLSEADLRQCDQATPILERHFKSEPVGRLQRLTGLALLSCTSVTSDLMPALQTVAKLKALYPDDPDILYKAAELDTRLWNQDAGVLIARHPESYRVHQLAGEVYEAQGNLDQAIREYKIVLEKNAKVPQMHYRIGQLYLRKGEADADDNAMIEFRAELAIDPQSAVSSLAMAEIERHDNKLDEALTQYQMASHVDPELVEAKVGMARVLLAQHKTDAAVIELHDALKQHPENAQGHYALMLAYREQGKMSEAAQEMEIFKKLQQRDDEQFTNKLNALLNKKSQSEPIVSR
jgi:tetratricopeptide (TPR) repeat protein